jgi:hypothetical protein
MDALVELRHESSEGLPSEITRLGLHIILELVLALSAPIQGACIPTM